MIYLFVKAFHIAAVVTWIGGMLTLSLVLGSLAHASLPREANEHRLLVAIHRWDRKVTTPALGLVWLLGITLAVMSGWYGAPWLWAKLAGVVLLSALHGNQSATIRRMSGDSALQAPGYMRLTAGFTVAAITAIILLVTLKPPGAL